MEDLNTQDQEEKTLAQIEEEARERARANMTSSEPEQAAKPGQPEVAKLKKKGSRRTLFVSVFSLLLIVMAAIAGDYVVKLIKNRGDNQEDKTRQAKADDTTRRERSFSIDTNPFDTEQTKEDQKDSQKGAPPPEAPKAPPALNKTAALVSDGRQTQRRSAENTPRNVSSRDDNAESDAPQTGTKTAYTSCKKLLVKGADGQFHCPAGAENLNSQADDNQEGNSGVARITGVKRMTLDPNLYIPVDRYIPCSMMQRFVSDVAGRISCLISEDVYSANGRVKLIPSGTVARGVYKSGSLQHGQGRLFIVWTELRTPDYLQIPLTDTQASGQLGENGIEGWIDSHFWERFGNAMMLSTVQDVAAAAASQSPSTNRNTDYTENSRAAAAEMAKQALDNSINIPPTMYKNQGDVISIMTGTDIDFSGVYRLRFKS